MSDRDRTADNGPGNHRGEPVAATAAERGATTRESVVQREKESFGGMKFGAAFFGWLTATGTAVLITTILASTGTAIGAANGATANDVVDAASSDAATTGVISAIVLALIILISYFCGGYVAGRMARFDGAKQGIAVWLWAILIAIVLAVIGAIVGSQSNISMNLDSLPNIPLDAGDLTFGTVLTAVIALILSLVGAVLGGLAGMRYHRKVDKAGLGR
jgi:amino acid transporter